MHLSYPSKEMLALTLARKNEIKMYYSIYHEEANAFDAYMLMIPFLGIMASVLTAGYIYLAIMLMEYIFK